MVTLLLWVCLSTLQATYGNIPSITLKNAAQTDVHMPVIGLGTGGYHSGRSNISKPENWTAEAGYNASLLLYSLNGTRFDSAITYESWTGVAKAIIDITNNYTTISRDSIFITSKTGPPLPLGYNDSMNQWKTIIDTFNTDHVDLLLIHWPTYVYDNASINTIPISTDPFCNLTNIKYSSKLCRQSTWRAYQDIFKMNGAKAIGVANFEINDLNDILEMKELIPSVNQFEFHGYWHEYDLVEYCQNLNITVNAYAPLGTPDVMYGDWPILLPQHPVAINMTKKIFQKCSTDMVKMDYSTKYCNKSKILEYITSNAKYGYI